EVGVGRLPEPEAMLEEVRSFFETSKIETSELELFAAETGRTRALVTAGGTSEAVDPVRVLTNTSTGETGVRLSNALATAGASVTLLLAKSSPFASQVVPAV